MSDSPKPGDVVEPEAVVEPDVFQQEGESQAEYIERVPTGVQPVLPAVEFTYLGDPR